MTIAAARAGNRLPRPLGQPGIIGEIVAGRSTWRECLPNLVYEYMDGVFRMGGLLHEKPLRWVAIGLAVALVSGSAAAFAHHSYAMFDMSQPRTVNGTVAKIEWVNPHVFVWLYAKKPGAESGYDLYAFENGPIGTMAHFGWTKQAFKPGERVTVEYFPLKDGRTGGYFVKATRGDGTVQVGDAYLPFIQKELAKDPAAQKVISH